MKTIMKSTDWVFVIVVNPGRNEKLLGQTDYNENISFIPTFKNQAAAKKGLPLLSVEEKNEHEVQAIIYEDLVRYASKATYKILLIDENGNTNLIYNK